MKIQSELNRIESQYDVRVLYAVESGSRAWGFASTDSDFDVRFIYLHKPEWYLSVETKRDVIEEPISDSLDISGWDLRKALGLLRKSNPPLLEWLKSPIVYRENAEFTSSFRALAAKYFSPEKCYLHYLGPVRQDAEQAMKPLRGQKKEGMDSKKCCHAPNRSIIIQLRRRKIKPDEQNYIHPRVPESSTS